MELSAVAEKVTIAVGLGLLVGLQRERVQSHLAGIRTFPLITVMGAVSALLGQTFGGWIVGLGWLALAAILVVGNVVHGKGNEVEPGVTTEMAALLMYGVGAYLIVGQTAVAIAIGGGVALLLHWKVPLHAFVFRIGEGDVRAIMRFVLVALVIYPILPDETYGPYSVLNPQQIWFMVVLFVSIGLAGYVAYKLFGERAGALLAGVLGGLISSTATTVAFARGTRQDGKDVPVSALMIVVASTALFPRVFAEIAVVAPTTFWQAVPPLAVVFAWTTLITGIMYFLPAIWANEEPEEPAATPDGSDTPQPAESTPETSPHANPAELLPAFIFAGLYALVLLGAAWANDYFGESGLFAIAIFSGLHDLDAITLSTARLVEEKNISVDVGWRLILVANLSNLVLKGALAALLGKRGLLKWIALPFGVAFLGGVVVLLVWP